MPTYFIHLENALKRANEFIEVQNKHRALEILCDVLHSKKHRTWQKKHEEIMLKYLQLCVELKQSYVAKEGIYQYKIICQQSYIGSFEDVIRRYIEMAEEKANQAKEESQANISEIDDLENAQTPEDILMSAVSSEGVQDRKDRVVLIPWVKFLWESYRQCLDLLRHNARTERLYHDIAHQAFKFCIKYNRKSEFRKLCDHLHLHLDQLKRQHPNQTPQQQQNSINLNSPETQALHLETRLIQLDYAIQLELWQEAYKATDDIKKFNLMNLKKGFGKPQLIASYYQKLALVFWKASSQLFHAAALFRLFHLSRDLRKNLSQEDVQKMASRLVVAVLSIPIPAIRPEIDKLVDTEENVIDQHHRNLSLLLGITSKPPTRASLVTDLKRMGVLQFASPQIQDLYQLLEVEFNPMGICGRVQQIIDYMEKATADPANATESSDIRQYVSSLKEVTVVRLIREVSQVFKTIEVTRLVELCPFVDKCQMERLVVESARRHDLQVRIDHRRGCYIFGTELRVFTGEEIIEGPYLQSMPNEQMRRQLVSMYSSLQKAFHLIEPDTVRKQREDLKKQIMKQYNVHATEEHHRILNRQALIEKRKEMIEQIGLQREMHERKRAEEEEARKRVAEELRLQEESKERERIRREKDEEELRKQMAKDQLKRMKDVLPDLQFEGIDEEELIKLKPQEIQQKRVEQLEKERREALAKQRKVERKIDHFERAKRLEELPLLQKQYEEWTVTDRELWDECEKLRIETMKAERELALKERERLRRVIEDKEEFTARVLQTRQSEFEERIRAFETIVNDVRKERLAQRREKRKEERRVRYYKEQEAKRLELQEEMQRRRLAEVEEKMRLAREAEEKENPLRNGPKAGAIASAAGGSDLEPQRSWRSSKPSAAAVESQALSSTEPPPIRPERVERDRDRDHDIDRDRDLPLRRRGEGDGGPPRHPPQKSVADQVSDWRRGPAPAPSAGGGGEGPPLYGGRHSDGRQGGGRRGGDGTNDLEGPPMRRQYGGRDSDSSTMRNRDERSRYGPPRGGDRYGDRDRGERGFDRDFRRAPPPMGGGERGDRGDRDREREHPTPTDGGGSWRRKAAPPQQQQDGDQQQHPPYYRGRDSKGGGGGNNDDGEGEGEWRQVDHGRKGGGDRGRSDHHHAEPPPRPQRR